MRKYLLSLLIVAGLLYPFYLNAGKIKPLQLKSSARNKHFEKGIHPLQAEFCRPREPGAASRNGDRLLVLLVEFNDEELIEDNPETTGRGKFILDDPDYPVDLGKPPHDHYFFTLQLQALRYYYRAASLYYQDGFSTAGFDLQFDIFPQPLPDRDFQAYTLPHSMAYYNPPDASPDLMIERFEEYFQDVFTTADTDPAIQFSQYGHFMFIHAGSDWQHDFLGDTPSDMPSFFIQIGDGKEVVVDEGEAVMDHACNVPETITQDISSYQYTGDSGNIVTVYENFGVINAVMAHEFGHSLGFVDLYNTSNFYPGVGYYDIMDSGGFGQAGIQIFDEEENLTDVYYVEGALPSLPGAWSRIIAWENDFRQRGILKDFSEFPLDEEIELVPSENRFDPFRDLPYLIRIPLSEDEYVLIENRQIDPDGDGGAALFLSQDDRVILYPTTYNEDVSDTTATYEYDYLLPGWFDTQGSAIGGGLLIWHIDNRIIFDQGNYETNSVNGDYYNRGVKIIEADNILDIGNPYSWFWRGTEFEAFFKYRPLLNEINNELVFESWDIPGTGGDVPEATHNDSLSALTAPALLTNTGSPSFFSIYNISSYPVGLNQERTMSFKVGTLFFDRNRIIAQYDSISALSRPGNTGYFSNEIMDFITIRPDETVFSYLLDNSVTLDWFHFAADFLLPQPTQPIITIDLFDDGLDDILLTADDKLYTISNQNFQYELEIAEFPTQITSPPLYLKETEQLVVCTRDTVYIDQNFFALEDARCIFNGQDLVAFNPDGITVIDPYTLSAASIQEQINFDLNSHPVTYYDLESQDSQVFFQDVEGNVYRFSNQTTHLIFNASPWGEGGYSQLALGSILADDNPYLVFGRGKRVFVLSLEGSLVPGFPGSIDTSEIKAGSYPRIIAIMNETLLFFKNESGGYIAFDNSGNFRAEFSIFLNSTQLDDNFYWDETTGILFFIYTDSSGNLISSQIIGNDQDPLLWSGIRHNDYSILYGVQQIPPEPELKMTAYAYPNPSRTEEVRIRISNAKRSIRLKIFDIAGNIVYNKNVDRESGQSQDIIWNTAGIASGLYFGMVSSGQEQEKIPIAIEK